MTYAILTSDDVPTLDRSRPIWGASLANVAGAAILAIGVVSVGWLVNGPPAAPAAKQAVPVGQAAVAPVGSGHASAGADPYAVLFDPDIALGFAPVSWARSHPLGSTFVTFSTTRQADVAAAPSETTAAESTAVTEQDPVAPMPDVSGDERSLASALPTVPRLVEVLPLPAPRPAELRSPSNRDAARPFGRSSAHQTRTAALAGPASDNRGFLDRFFGMFRPTGPLLAYASPEDGVLGGARGAGSAPALPYDRWTAVYDIAAHTVYMPNGTRLEAHSGLGDRLDDPHHVNERMRGATPPHLYDLEPRAQLFHGVQALRLNPVGGGGVFGRTGLLAHTYMLGPNGDSNGCVSFKDYRAFRQAFSNGEVRRLAVVARFI